MTHNTQRTLATVLLFMVVVLVGTTHTVSASEVTGTLSSDGSSETTNSGSAGGVGATTVIDMKGDHTLSGTVVNGMEDQGSNSSLSTVLWSLSAVLVVAILATVYLRRRQNV